MLESLALSVTYRCPIQCKYCGVNASPHRREKMSLAFIVRIIDEVDALGAPEPAPEPGSLYWGRAGCDDFHQAFIPLDRIKWANEAASAVDLPALLAVKGLQNSVITIAECVRLLSAMQ